MARTTNIPTLGYIYCIENKSNGKKYVGKSNRAIGARWSEHLKHAMLGKKKHKLYDAMRKDGFDKFEFNILEQHFGTDAELDELEVKYIKELDAFPGGYNSDVGGTGRKRVEKDLTKVSVAHGATRGRRAVVGIDLKTGAEVRYGSLTEAARAVGGQGSKISNVARGKAMTAYGYKWRWADA